MCVACMACPCCAGSCSAAFVWPVLLIRSLNQPRRVRAAGRPLCHWCVAGRGHGAFLAAAALVQPAVAGCARAPACAGHAAPERRAGGDRSRRAVRDMGSAVQCALELAPPGGCSRLAVFRTLSVSAGWPLCWGGVAEAADEHTVWFVQQDAVASACLPSCTRPVFLNRLPPQDIMGVCFMLVILKQFFLPNLKVASILLCLAFVYGEPRGQEQVEPGGRCRAGQQGSCQAVDLPARRAVFYSCS